MPWLCDLDKMAGDRIQDEGVMTGVGQGRRQAAMLGLALLVAAGCAGPGTPGAMTPSLPPAKLWAVHIQAGYEAELRGHDAEAERYYLKALQEAEQLKIVDPAKPKEALGQDPALVTSLNTLANFYTARGRYGEALPLLNRALSFTEFTYGEDHPYVAVTLRNLAALRKAQKLYVDAEDRLKRALAIDQKALGRKHPAVGDDLTRLGEVAAAQGRTADAEVYFDQGLRIRENALGLDHPDVAISLMSMGNFYQSHDQNATAEAFYARALGIREKALGPDHPFVADTLEDYAGLLRKTGRTEQARSLEQRAEAIRDRISKEPIAQAR